MTHCAAPSTQLPAPLHTHVVVRNTARLAHDLRHARVVQAAGCRRSSRSHSINPNCPSRPHQVVARRCRRAPIADAVRERDAGTCIASEVLRRILCRIEYHIKSTRCQRGPAHGLRVPFIGMIDIEHEDGRPQITVSSVHNGAAAAADLRGGPAREYAKGGERTRRTCAGASRERFAQWSAEQRRGGRTLSAGRRRWPDPRRANQFGRGHRSQGHADQLLRATDGRFDLQATRTAGGHLRGAKGSRRDDAPRWRRWLRLLADPPAGCVRQGHATAAQRAAFIHARFRPSCETVESGRLAPRRANGRAALRPSRTSSFVHAKDEASCELQHVRGVTDDFMQRLVADGEFELVHKAQPAPR